MKTRLLISLLVIFINITCFGQNVHYNKKGTVKEVTFQAVKDKDKIPKDAKEFTKEYLKFGKDDEWKQKPHKRNRDGLKNERFDQYYKGVKVEHAGYTFHYKNDTMVYAHGNFVAIGNLDTNPTLTPVEARNAFTEYKKIPIDSIVSFQSELLIKEVYLQPSDSLPIPKLTYRIYLETDLIENDEIGYVDAHTGKVVATAPKIWRNTYDGTFSTRYSGTQTAKTMLSSSVYILRDNSRAATIHTKNLNNSTTNAVEVTDNDNNWTSAEHTPNNIDMGLDVHWALQKIYDYFQNNYSISSFDDDNSQVNAFIRYGYYNDDKDNAAWNPNDHTLLFGEGATLFHPVASLDVVAHEYGHGISDMQIGLSYDNGTMGAIQEGLSDIWAVVLENAINPVSIWQIGDQVVRSGSCLRNIANPTDASALTQLSVTYGASSFNSAATHYVKSGVFSYWFYLLVNGGSSTNENGNEYSLCGVGMDLAEELLTNSIYDGYLDNVSSFSDLRSAFSNAANTYYGSSSFIKYQVESAWYAVGVGTNPTPPFSISGSSTLCYSGSSYLIPNLPGCATISWNPGLNITRVSEQDSNPCTFRASTSNPSYNGYSTITANISINGSTIAPISKMVHVGTPVPSFGVCNSNLIVVATGEVGTQYYARVLDSGTSSSSNDYLWEFTPPEDTGDELILPETGNGITCSFVPSYPGTWTVNLKYNGTCGWSAVKNMSFVVTGQRLFSLYPNPTSGEFTIELLQYDENTDNEEYNIEIYDQTMIKQKKTKTTNKKTSVNVSNLKKGIYYVKVQGKNKSEIKKLMVE